MNLYCAVMRWLPIIWLTWVSISTAQQPAYKEPKQKEKPLEILIQEADSGNKDAILELGKMGNREIIPILQHVREKNKNMAFGSVSSCAQMALAKLGDRAAMNEIRVELKSDEPMVQDHAIKKLAYINNNNAIEILVNMLGNNNPRKMKGYDPNMRGPKGEMPIGKILYEPINVIALKALLIIIPSPINPVGKLPTQENINEWREWWIASSNRYCNPRSNEVIKAKTP